MKHKTKWTSEYLAVLFCSPYYDDQMWSVLSTWLQLLSNALLFKNHKHCCLTLRRSCIWFQAGAFLSGYSGFLPQFKNMRVRLTGVFKMATSMNVGACGYLRHPYDELARGYPASCPMSAGIGSGRDRGIYSDQVLVGTVESAWYVLLVCLLWM